MSETQNPSVAPLQSMRVLALTLCAAPVAILVAIYFVLGGEPEAFSPPPWALAVPLGLAVAAALAITVVGYRAAPVEPSTPAPEAAATGAQVFQQLMVLRFALAEAPMIISLAFAFLVPSGGFLVVALGVVCALVLLVWHVLPNDGQVDRVQSALESRGARVPLGDHLRGRPVA